MLVVPTAGVFSMEWLLSSRTSSAMVVLRSCRTDSNVRSTARVGPSRALVLSNLLLSGENGFDMSDLARLITDETLAGNDEIAPSDRADRRTIGCQLRPVRRG